MSPPSPTLSTHTHLPPVSLCVRVCVLHNMQNKRYALLGAFAFAQGATIGPLVELALAISPALLMTATLSTAAIFTCFTLSALFTKRRSAPVLALARTPEAV